jgi:hypothetical protein
MFWKPCEERVDGGLRIPDTYQLKTPFYDSKLLNVVVMVWPSTSQVTLITFVMPSQFAPSTGAPSSFGKVKLNLSPLKIGIVAYTDMVKVFTAPFT